MPVVTAADLINDAARINGKLGPGRTLSQSEQDDALRIFQRLVDAWTIESLMIFSRTRSTYTLIPGRAPITIGSYGDWETPRPIRIESMGLVLTGVSPSVETPIEMLTDDQWAAKRVKDLASNLPRQCWYNDGWPLGSLYFWPVPIVANDVALYHWAQLTGPAALESIIRFPPGYEQAFVDNLAVATCPLFGRRPTPELQASALESKARLKRYNHTADLMRVDAAIAKGNSAPGIAQFYSGE